MPRYSLILRHETYVVLWQEAMRRNISLGKLINEILDNYVKNLGGQLPAQPICIVCGAKATLEVHGKGQQRFFVCPLHRDYAKNLEGYREL